MTRIKLTRELRDYIESLQYETNRYKDLLRTVNRDCCPMTDDEWNSSMEYFTTLATEAQFCLNVAKKEISEMYADVIKDQPWCINFADCELVVGTMYVEPRNEKKESYSDQLRRLFPREVVESIKMNGTHCKDITLQVTDACNMACSYCYQHKKSNHAMTFDVAKKFIDMILDADERTNTYITSTNSDGAVLNFIGGEPWLQIDLISQVSDYFIGEVFRRKHPWAIKFCLNVCSNGLLHFDPRVQKYMQRHRGHFNYNISIDGNQELHDSCRVDLAGNGTYERAIAGVNHFRDVFKGVMGSKMTIAPGNVDKVFSAVAYMIKDNHYNNIHLNCVYEEGWTNEHANTLYWELHKLTDWLFDNNLQDDIVLSIFSEHCAKPLDESHDQNWCGGAGLMLAVDYKGDIYPCLRYMESSVADEVPPYIIGNIEDGINNKPEHSERIDCFKCVTRRSQSTDECFNCPIAMGCGWCSAHNYQTFGTVNKRATFICCMHKARSLANVYYWRRRGVDLPMQTPAVTESFPILDTK